VLLKIYATGGPSGSRSGGPSLIVDADNMAALPHHPTGRVWRYIATVSNDDAMFVSHRDAVAAALTNRGFYASRHVLGVGAAHPHAAVERHHHLTAADGPPMSYQRQQAELAFLSV
jgi:hypothetical protein